MANNHKPERIADQIQRGLDEVLNIVEGRKLPAHTHTVMVPAVDVKALRAKLSMSQEAFALRFGFSKANVRNWEQERNAPTGAARTLLLIIEREPEAALRAVSPQAA